MKRSPLKRGKSRLRRKTPLKKRNETRKRERFRKTFGPDGFVEWLKARACVGCGRAPPCEVHHEPTRSAGGLWTDTVPLCRRCHCRRHRIGVETFWREIGLRYGTVTGITQARWLARHGSEEA